MHRHLLISATIATAFQLSSATNLYTSTQRLETTEWDFIVIGGGTAVCLHPSKLNSIKILTTYSKGPVIANRLSSSPNTTVLLIEAGPSHHDFPNARIPFLAPKLASTGADWNYTTTPQPGYNNRSIAYTRGHVLGGSSTINYMAYNRASNETYDRWAQITGDNAWSWGKLEPYYLRNAHLVPPPDGRNYSQDVIASAHGYGPVDVSVAAEPYPLDYRVINASKEMGGRFAFNRDLNAGDFVGTSWTQGAIGKGERDSAATAYLDPLLHGAGKRRGLDVLLNTQVSRLVKGSGEEEDGAPAFRVAEMVASGSNATVRLTARKEIILSAGIVGTTQILLQSGIGPASELAALGIPSVVDLPSVGKNLTDHPLTPLYFTSTQPTTNDALMRNPARMQQALAQWNMTHDGPLANTASNTYAFLRLPENATILERQPNPAAGPEASNFEILFDEGFAPLTTSIAVPDSGNYITVLTVVTSPTSRGSITLNSSDPLAHPVINPNYLATDFDQYTAVQALKDVFTFFENNAFDGFIGGPYGPLANRTTDAQLLDYVKMYASTIYHSVGTAKMAPRGADWGVVDPDLKVKGTRGLRVADASVFVSQTGEWDGVGVKLMTSVA
jgi:choline dehydrogenase-like flavoprotein